MVNLHVRRRVRAERGIFPLSFIHLSRVAEGLAQVLAERALGPDGRAALPMRRRRPEHSAIPDSSSRVRVTKPSGKVWKPARVFSGDQPHEVTPQPGGSVPEGPAPLLPLANLVSRRRGAGSSKTGQLWLEFSERALPRPQDALLPGQLSDAPGFETLVFSLTLASTAGGTYHPGWTPLRHQPLTLQSRPWAYHRDAKPPAGLERMQTEGQGHIRLRARSTGV